MSSMCPSWSRRLFAWREMWSRKNVIPSWYQIQSLVFTPSVSPNALSHISCSAVAFGVLPVSPLGSFSSMNRRVVFSFEESSDGMEIMKSGRPRRSQRRTFFWFSSLSWPSEAIWEKMRESSEMWPYSRRYDRVISSQRVSLMLPLSSHLIRFTIKKKLSGISG